ncbi:PEP-CTERM protein-sorting domain-containing protein [Bradyrhizobium lablabi]|nr:PEPxxWA-CTERM sorting domain-containing protein [Bradyrhizobium lablabi]SHK60755.1 PEP-CTERM protein-sorting domain-containing protein [Bradyrhizobium lablabi]
MKKIIGSAIALLSMCGLANANTVQGSIWENVPGAAGDATIANTPGTAPDVTFNVSTPISFDSGSAYTIGEFLTSGGASVLTGSGELGHTLDNTFFQFLGSVSVTNGQTFTVGHDDGLTLVIGGLTVIDLPGGHSPGDDTVTYTGPTGTFAFDLVYGEAFGAPAQLHIDLPLTSSVPEPSTWAMLILGFAGVGFMAYRRKSKPRLIAA